jgi:hypothetical protein
MGIYLVPVNGEVLMYQHIAQSGNRGKTTGKLDWQYTDLAQPDETLVVIGRLECFLQRNDSVGDVDAALHSYLGVTLRYVAQIGIFEELLKRSALKGL